MENAGFEFVPDRFPALAKERESIIEEIISNIGRARSRGSRFKNSSINMSQFAEFVSGASPNQ